MIFGVGLFIFTLAFLLTWANRPEPIGGTVATFGLMGFLMMLASICMLFARWMP